jgi:predicted MFS family arabinose efflux permease
MNYSMTRPQAPWKIISILSFTEVVSWGSLYYAFAILAPEMQRELGWRAEVVFGAFSWSLLVAGLTATPAGMLLDRFGGRVVMSLGSLAGAAGFIALATVQSAVHYFAAWTVLGVAMALTLYEAAFATINREFSENARRAISTVTLFGGLASTVSWPLTLKLNGMVGWRETFIIFGVAHLVLCAPLHALLVPRKRRVLRSEFAHALKNYTLKEAIRHPVFWKLAFAFSANSFIFSALSVHLIPLLQHFGHPIVTVVFLATLIGPMQVAGRIGEMTFARHALPQTVGKLTFFALPAALLALLFFGEYVWAVASFCILYGLSNGIMTIVRGTVPQALFGRENYGAIAGALAGPSLISKAGGPLAAAAVMQLSPSVYPLLGVLLLLSAVSLGFYLAAVKTSRQELNSALSSG